MKRHSQGIFCSIFLLVAISAYTQNNGRISGTVVDKSSQKPLSNVSIRLEGSTNGALSDSSGVFRITGILWRTYNITFSSVGYKTQTVYNIIINAGYENTINAELEPDAVALSEVVIKTNKRTARAATLETPLSVQRLTSEEITLKSFTSFMSFIVSLC